MQLYTFEQAGIIHNAWYNKVYSCVCFFADFTKGSCLYDVGGDHLQKVYPRISQRFS